MAPVEIKILEVLGNSGELSMNDLVQKVREGSATTATEVRAAVLPLISGESVDMTPDRKLRLKAHA
jgi:hypothetical protein